jgi:translation initiation factor IF-2
VEVLGFNDVPQAGDLLRIADHEKDARALVAEREERRKNNAASRRSGISLENMFERAQAGEVRELRLVVKADVQGSLEPIVNSLQDISASDEHGQIRVHVIHSDTGNISESDIMLAAASEAVVLGFNVEADSGAQKLAERDHISIRKYDIIYRLTEDVEKALKGMLEPEEVEKTIGRAEVRAVFKIRKIGNIAGCRVVDGEIRRNARIRVLRGEKVIHTDEISSLKHEAEDVREVRNGFECGIGVKGFEEFKEGDVLECFITELVQPI